MKRIIAYLLLIVLAAPVGIAWATCAGHGMGGAYRVDFSAQNSIDNSTACVTDRLFTRIACEQTASTGTGIRNATVQTSLYGTYYVNASTANSIDPGNSDSFKWDIVDKAGQYIRIHWLIGLDVNNTSTIGCYLK